MKRLLTTFLLFGAIMFCTQKADAQLYKNGIGLRLGWGYGLTFKHFLSEKAALEATPSVYINCHKLEGPPTVENLRTMIQWELAK